MRCSVPNGSWNGKWQHVCVFTDVRHKCSGFVLNNLTGSARLRKSNWNGWCEINCIFLYIQNEVRSLHKNNTIHFEASTNTTKMFQSQNACTICHFYAFSFDSLKSRTGSNERLFFFVFPGILYIWTKHTRQSTQQPQSRHIEIWNFKEKIENGRVWFIHGFLWLKSGNNTNTITSKISNWFHVDENFNTLEISGATVS